jgi:ArsR family metal-binding transcriptional regulator
MARDYSIVITRPCTDAPGTFIAESSFGKAVTMESLCGLMKGIEGSKCSESLGIAKFDMDGKTFIVYRSGRVDMRKIKNEQDAHDTMSKLDTMLEKVFIQK